MRRLVTTLALFLLLLFAVVVVAWVRSHTGSGDRWSGVGVFADGRRYERADWRVSSGRGQLRAYRERLTLPPPETIPQATVVAFLTQLETAESRRGSRFSVGWDTQDREPLHARTVWFACPYWAAAAVTGAVPAGWLVTTLVSLRRQRRWAGLGFCRGCGYDLRESKERCPECGAAVE